MNPSPAASAFRAAFSTPLARLVGIGLLLLVLLIPACAIRDVVHERDTRRQEAVAEAIGKSSFGVSFTTPVDHYRMAERITKYAVMTLVFTFTVIWLTEILAGARVHLIQYGFTGAALCLFGLLQLSFAEHFGFNLAFLAAAAAVIAMVTLYTRAVLNSMRRALGVGGVLAGLYGYLYMILRAEDHALLGGSLALFAGLAVAMYLTRRIDWSAASTPAEPR